MANYTKATNFTAKDSLPSGNAGKIIKGAEIDTEFTAIASAIASKADLNSPSLTGTPTAPTATASTNTTQLATTAFVQSAISNAITGIIVMWSGSIANIPSGWALCNGSNGTPDLRNRFIIGAHSDNVGVANTTVTGTSTLTGGSKDAIVVSHTHTATSVVTDPGHFHISGMPSDYSAFGTSSISSTFQKTGSALVSLSPNTDTKTTGITVATTNSTEGSSGTNQNLPPYYALAFIQKL
jgi:hypothetical protein